MIDYKILQKDYSVDLEKIVKEYLAMGWRLQGGISVYVVNDSFPKYTQAVIK